MERSFDRMEPRGPGVLSKAHRSRRNSAGDALTGDFLANWRGAGKRHTRLQTFARVTTEKWKKSKRV